MLLSLHLLNWRSHKDSTLHFKKGTNLLIGIMGSGKSSVLHAICFALFGTFPSLDRRRMKLEDLLRLNEDRSAVKLEFEWNNSKYLIERRIERKKSISTTAEIFRDGSLVESGSASVTSYVENLLKIDYDLFTRAIYSEQNNIDYFLNLDPRRRKEEIDVLLGLDKFEIARSNIVTVINRIRYDRSILEKRYLPETIPELEKKLADNSKKSNELAEKRHKLHEEMDKLQVKLAHLHTVHLSLKEKNDVDDQLSKNQLRTESRLDLIKKEIAGKNVDQVSHELSKKRLSDEKLKRESISKELVQLDNSFLVLQKSIASSEAGIASLLRSAKQKEELEKELDLLAGGKTTELLSVDLSILEKQIISVSSEIKHLESGISELSDLIGKIKPEMGSCPLCDAPLTSHSSEKIKREKEARISEYKKRIAELKTVISEKTIAQKNLSETIRKLAVIKHRMEQIISDSRNLPSLELSLKQSSSELNQLSSVRSVKQGLLRDVQKQIELLSVEVSTEDMIIRKKQECTLLEQQLAEILLQRNKLSFNKDEYESSRKNLEDCRLAAEQAKHSLDIIVRDLESSKEIHALLQKQLDESRKDASEIAYLAQIEEQLAMYRNALLEIQITLRSNLTDAINSAMNEIWGIFYPYRNYSSLRLEVTEKDYHFKVFDGNEWRLIESMASGGERACAALTLRVALAMVLTPNLGWMILDEPTHNLDREAVLLLSETLQLKVPEVVNQIFVITHEEALMGSDFASSYRLNRDKENAGATIIEPM